MPSSAMVTVIGHAGKDAEQRNPSGPVSFSVAVSKGKDKPTTWFRIAVWGKLGEIALKYVRKGGLVAVTGRLEVREYQKNDGTTGYSVDVTANELLLLGGRDHAEKPVPQEPTQPVAEDEIPF